MAEGAFAWSYVTNQYEFWPYVDAATAQILQDQADLEACDLVSSTSS